MSGSFESVRWNACVHRLDLGSYSHPEEECVFLFVSLFVCFVLFCFVLFFVCFVCLGFFFVFVFFIGGRGGGGGRSQNSRLLQGKSPLYWERKKFLRGGMNLQRCIKQDNEPNTLPTSYSGPTFPLFLVIWSLSGSYHAVLAFQESTDCQNIGEWTVWILNHTQVYFGCLHPRSSD